MVDLNKYIVDPTIDVAFKKIFLDERNKWYLAFIIHYVTGINLEYIESHILYKHPHGGTNNKRVRTGEADILVDVDYMRFDIEMNRVVNEEAIKKNNWYIRNMATGSKRRNEKFRKDNRMYIQINLSLESRFKEKKKMLYKIVPMEVEILEEDVYNNLIIYDINLEYLKKELYTKDKLEEKEKKLLIFIEQEKKKLYEVYRSDRKMKELVDQISEYQDQEDFIIEYDHEAYKQNVHECELEDKAKEAARNKSIEIAKKMLKKGIDVTDIQEITNLSQKEIEELQ